MVVAALVLGLAAPSASATLLGWAVGDGGTILRTIDGGGSWAPQPSGTGQNLLGVEFVDALNGWAVGDGGTILHTIDGGGSWAPQPSGTGTFLAGVKFVDALNGWAVGGVVGTILHTSNGGATWAPQRSGTNRDLHGVEFVDALNGWAVGGAGTILHTSAGGGSWAPQDSGTGQQILLGVKFVDALNGWAVGQAGTILHTSNGGATWAPQDSGTGAFLTGVKFVDALNGWAVGQAGLGSAGGGTILHTIDGGAAWAPQDSGTFVTGAFFLRGVEFADVLNGWAVGGTVGGVGGTILHTSNGGVTWAPQDSGTGATLHGIAVVPAPGDPLMLPLQTQRSTIRATGDFAWTSQYAMSLTGHAVHIMEAIQLTGDDPGDDLRRTWESGIERVWNNRFDIVDDQGFRYPILVDVNFVNSNPDQIVSVHANTRPPGACDPKIGRDNMSNWFTDRPGCWPNDRQGDVVAHEFGHMLGLFDEYPRGALNPDINPNTFTNSIMADLGPPHERHFLDILAQLSGRTDRHLSLAESPLAPPPGGDLLPLFGTTEDPPTTVPEPATVALVVTGLIILRLFKARPRSGLL